MWMISFGKFDQLILRFHPIIDWWLAVISTADQVQDFNDFLIYFLRFKPRINKGDFFHWRNTTYFRKNQLSRSEGYDEIW